MYQKIIEAKNSSAYKTRHKILFQLLNLDKAITTSLRNSKIGLLWFTQAGEGCLFAFWWKSTGNLSSQVSSRNHQQITTPSGLLIDTI
jgi:hypothetical protein